MRDLNPVTTKLWVTIIYALISFLIPFLPAIKMLGRMIKDMRDGFKSKKWNEAQGVIVASALGGGTAGDVSPHTVLYQYTVNEKEYYGTRKTIGGSYSSETEWRDYKKYPRGDIVSVYYNPDNPAQATLIPGMRWDNLLMLIFIPFILLAQLIFYLIIHLTLWDLSWIMDLF